MMRSQVVSLLVFGVSVVVGASIGLQSSHSTSAGASTSITPSTPTVTPTEPHQPQTNNSRPTFSKRESPLAKMDELISRLEALRVEDLEQVLAEPFQDKSEHVNYYFMAKAFILAHWMDHDLEAAREGIRVVQSPNSDDMPMDEVAPALLAMAECSQIRRGGEKAFTRLIQESPSDYHRRQLKGVHAYYHPQFDPDWAKGLGIPIEVHLQPWLERSKDFEGLLQAIINANSLNSDERTSLIGRLFEELPYRTQITLEASVKLLESLPNDEDVRAKAKNALAIGWRSHPHSLTSLKAVLALSGSLTGPSATENQPLQPPPPGRERRTANSCRDALSAYPEETVAWIMNELDEATRKAAVDDIFKSSGHRYTEITGWLTLYAALPREERPETYIPRLYGLSSTHPRTTLGWLADFSNREPEALDNYFSSWASDIAKTLTIQNPEESLTILHDLRDGPIKHGMAQGLIAQLSNSQPEKAKPLLELLPENDRLDSEAIFVSNYFQTQGIQEGMRYLNQLEDQETREAFIDKLIAHGGGVSPAERALLVDTYRHDSEDPLADTHRFNEGWAESDPAAAGEWLATYSDSPSYERRLERLIERWRFKDFEGAMAYVQSLPPSPSIDRAISHISGLIGQVDPAAALQWHLRLSDPQKRLQALEYTLTQLDELGLEPTALESLPITEEEKQTLQERLSQSP